jgi:hypothetical protein
LTEEGRHDSTQKPPAKGKFEDLSACERSVTPTTAARVVWLAIAVLAAGIVALAAASLSYLSSRNLATAMIRGGVAFGTTVGLLVAMYTFLA